MGLVYKTLEGLTGSIIPVLIVGGVILFFVKAFQLSDEDFKDWPQRGTAAPNYYYNNPASGKLVTPTSPFGH